MSEQQRQPLPETQRLEPDRSHVVHETIDGETILIDLDTGTYFSLAGTAPEIWELVMTGLCAQDVTRVMAMRYPEAAAHARAETLDLIVKLWAEGLLDAVGPLPATPSHEAVPDPAAFAPPTIQRYTDMQEFLMLDPIHEVDDAGWPHLPAPPAVESG